MSGAMPAGELDARYSSEGAAPTAWEEARDRLAGADVCFLSTVRPNGRPHVTPLLSVWLEGAAHFCTGPDEQKARKGWRFDVRDGAFAHDAGTALVFEVAPATVFAFGKGDAFSQTRWRLGQG